MNLGNYTDMLPSVLVKDFKQFLRGKVSWIFLCILWCLLGLGTISVLNLGALEGSNFITDSSYEVGKTILAAVLCIFFPMLGFGSVRQDMKKGSYDFIVLTGQSSWYIVLSR